MLINWKRYLYRTLPLAGLCLALAGCGGSGGGQGVNGAGTSTLSGIAAKGPVKQARISVYKMKADGTADTSQNLVLSGSRDMTDDTGHYSVSIPVNSGPVVVMVRPILGTTTYADETDPANAKPLTATLRAAVPDSGLVQNVAVTPLTEAAVSQVAAIRQANAGAGIADVINAANFQVAQSFGVPDILTPPATAAFDPNSIATATPADQAYVAALTMVSQIVNNPGSNLPQAINTITTIVDPSASEQKRTEALGVISAAVTQIATTVPTLPAGTLTAVSSAVTTAATSPASPVQIVVRTLTAPMNLSQTSLTSQSVGMAWDASPAAEEAVGYYVYRNGSLVAKVSQPAFVDTALAVATQYTYQLKAYDATGNVSAFSNTLTVTTPAPASDTAPPSAPTGLSATTFTVSATTSSVVLTWTPSTDNAGVAGYEIYRGTTKIATVSQPGYTDANVSAGATYNYYVIAFDAAGNRSAQSSTLPVTPNQASLGVTVNGRLDSAIIGLPGTDIFAPTAPTGLGAATSATSATTSSIVLTWTPSTDNVGVAGYEVYRVAGASSTKIATVSQPGYTDAGAPSGTPSTYFVIAFDAAGNRSLASNQLSITPNTANLGVTVNGQLIL